MAEEIAFENGRISNFKGLVALILTLDQVILHTLVHQSSTSTYAPNFTEIKQTVCERTDGRTDGHALKIRHYKIRQRRERRRSAYFHSSCWARAPMCRALLPEPRSWGRADRSQRLEGPIDCRLDSWTAWGFRETQLRCRANKSYPTNDNN